MGYEALLCGWCKRIDSQPTGDMEAARRIDPATGFLVADDGNQTARSREGRAGSIDSGRSVDLSIGGDTPRLFDGAPPWRKSGRPSSQLSPRQSNRQAGYQSREVSTGRSQDSAHSDTQLPQRRPVRDGGKHVAAGYQGGDKPPISPYSKAFLSEKQESGLKKARPKRDGASKEARPGTSASTIPHLAASPSRTPVTASAGNNAGSSQAPTPTKASHLKPPSGAPSQQREQTPPVASSGSASSSSAAAAAHDSSSWFRIPTLPELPSFAVPANMPTLQPSSMPSFSASQGLLWSDNPVANLLNLSSKSSSRQPSADLQIQPASESNTHRDLDALDAPHHTTTFSTRASSSQSATGYSDSSPPAKQKPAAIVEPKSQAMQQLSRAEIRKITKALEDMACQGEISRETEKRMIEKVSHSDPQLLMAWSVFQCNGNDRKFLQTLNAM